MCFFCFCSAPLATVVLFLAAGCRPGTAPVAASPVALAADGNAPEVHFAVVGDFGVALPPARAVAQMVAKQKPDFVVTTGDNNYPDGAQKTLDVNISDLYGPFIAFGPRYRGSWQGRGSPTQRFFPTLGNHDWDTAGAQPYLNAFALPGNGRYYTVRQGPVALFMVDSDPREPDGVDVASVQAAWLRQALATSSAPHRWVVLHHPPYSSSRHGSSVQLRWPFRAWGATAVLSGHNHVYERYQVEGLPYVVNGIGGQRLEGLPARCQVSLPGSDAPLTAVVCHAGVYGALFVRGDARSLEVRAMGTGGEEIDRFVLPAAAAGPAPRP